MSKNQNTEKGLKQRAEAVKLWSKHPGNISAIAREMGIERANVRRHLRMAHIDITKPISSGTMFGNVAEKLPLPPKGRVRRFLLTSAQNNTPLNEPMWENLNALARHYDAGIMVGTYTYNTNAYGKLAVKRGTHKERIHELWYDQRLEGHIVDRRVELGNGLVWCGEMNILPTAANPLEGLETYSHRKSAIIPHAKLAMKTIPTMLGEWAKILYTTGTVTQSNYIQKKEGLKAEHHHSYSALLVEVNDQGNWWARQVHFNSKTADAQDLDVCVSKGKVTTGNRVEAITWGDLHGTKADVAVVKSSMEMLDFLKPKHQFLHDIFEGASFSRHQVKHKNPHVGFHRWLRGLHRVDEELKQTMEVLSAYDRKGVETYVVDSNHDGWWLKSWLAKYDYRVDPANSELFLDLQRFFYSEVRSGKMPRDVNITEKALELAGFSKKFKFLLPDESKLICGNKIECGMHGHLGPNGSFGTPANLNKVGRRANTAHTHSAGIYNGLYVAGHSSEPKWEYNYGPSGWNHSHILTYPNGARSIVTMYRSMWRAS